MRKTLIAILLALALVVVPAAGVLADTTADVTVTATPGWVSITNLPIDYDFDVVLAGIDEQTTNGYFTITNDSTVAMDINIQCDGWTGTPTNSWTYGTPDEDQGQLKASSANGGVGGSGGVGLFDVVIPEGVDALLCDAVVTTTDPTWELQLDAPSSFTYVDVQETTVTLTAAPD